MKNGGQDRNTDAWYTNTRLMVAMNKYVAGVLSVGLRKPRAVTGSVGDSCTVRGLGMAVSDVDPEWADWSRCR